METASFVISIIGTTAGVAGLIVSIILAKRTSIIRNELHNKFAISLAVMHFNVTKKDYIDSLNDIRCSILENPSSPLSLQSWSELDLTLNKIQSDISEIKESRCEEIKKTIITCLNYFNNTDDDPVLRNKNLIGYLDTIITFLETYMHIGG